MRSRERSWLTRRELNCALNSVFPDSLHVYAFQFGTSGRWTACYSTIEDGYPVNGFTSNGTYDTHWQALQAAYRFARERAPLPDYRPHSAN
jgi:hypothetical protein